MVLPSLQVCMDSSDWFQGAIASHEVNNELMIDTSSSSPSGADNMILTSYPGPPSSRVLRPPHDHALNCPRCDSTHTKFCYYNNYSLTQPRYFCKTCRRYWTKGGTLRNIPVGGGCRKNKKITHHSKKEKASSDYLLHHHFSAHQNQVGGLLGGQGSGLNEQHPMLLPIDFMECSRNNSLGMIGELSGAGGVQSNFNGVFSPFGYSSYEGAVENYQKIMNPYEVLNNEDDYGNVMDDVKPNTKLMCFDNWQNNVDKDYSVGLGSWTSSMINNRF